MKLGLLSDTHGNVMRTRNACDILAAQQIAAAAGRWRMKRMA